MEREKIRKLLEYGNVDRHAIDGRLELLSELEEKVIELPQLVLPFRGIIVYGSVLNGKFDPNRSDIDYFDIWKEYNPDGKGSDDRIFAQKYAKFVESELTKLLGIKCNRFMNMIDTDLYNFGVKLVHPIFGVYLGDEDFRNGLIRDIVRQLEKSGKEEWEIAQQRFNDWGLRDLTNPQGGYKLSDFEKIKQLYS